MLFLYIVSAFLKISPPSMISCTKKKIPEQENNHLSNVTHTTMFHANIPGLFFLRSSINLISTFLVSRIDLFFTDDYHLLFFTVAQSLLVRFLCFVHTLDWIMTNYPLDPFILLFLIILFHILKKDKDMIGSLDIFILS